MSFYVSENFLRSARVSLSLGTTELSDPTGWSLTVSVMVGHCCKRNILNRKKAMIFEGKIIKKIINKFAMKK